MRKNKQDPSTLVYGKVPPNAYEVEQAVIGAIILQSEVLDHVADMLIPESFYRESHGIIYRACLDIWKSGNKVDLLTVVDKLQKTGEIEAVGGSSYIAGLTNKVSSPARIISHCRIVFEKWMKREIIKAGGILIHEGYEESDPFESMDRAESVLYAVQNKLQQNRQTPLDALLVQTMYDIENRVEEANRGEYISGVPSGFRLVDKLTHGWQNGDLIILAARPSVGKTALALALARNAAKNEKKPTAVAVFSLEMSAKQITERLISAESKVELERIKNGRIEPEQSKLIFKAVQKLSQMKIIIDDTPSMNIFELRAKARKLKNSSNIGLLIIDYLQLMNGVGNEHNREREIADISRGLKQLAKELDIPVIALSQLSREVEKRKEGHIPKLSDLRESGAIEQDADTVVFIYRPEYHQIQHNSMGESTVGETHLRFAKHRNGKVDTVIIKAQLWIQDFVEADQAILSPIYNGNGLDFKKNAANDKIIFPSQLGTDLEDDPF